MKKQIINNEDRQILLELARRSIEAAARKRSLPRIRLSDYSSELQQYGASFVTLTIQGVLRGCIGTLEPYQPLVLDVIEHAAAAAVKDHRFHPLSAAEIPMIEIEISVLTPAIKLEYSHYEELFDRLQPGITGVILVDGKRRATFLPQVWSQLPDKEEFLSHLCSKMGVVPDFWKENSLEVFTYQVEEFHD